QALLFGTGGLGATGAPTGRGGLIIGEPVNVFNWLNPPSGNEQSIVIDFVRHGQTTANVAGLMDTAIPGANLTAVGQQQAVDIANILAPQGPFAGLFDSQLVRTQQTAAPLAAMLGMTPGVLPGLNEINAGIFEDFPQISPAGLLYLAGPMAWTFGLPIVPMLNPGSIDFNGVVFGHTFNGAVQTMYDAALANPVPSADGKVTVVSYSSAFTIGVGTMMAVDNPNPLLILTHSLPNTGTVVLQGDPTGGWTMTSWDGIPVAPASLPTQLFVDVRNLITAPQIAAFDIGWSLFTGDPATIVNAVRTGIDEVGTAVVQFPIAVAEDVIHAVWGAVPVP
ncbi:histidine phosphatase family protein, partial [Mycobacterium kansasii]